MPAYPPPDPTLATPDLTSARSRTLSSVEPSAVKQATLLTAAQLVSAALGLMVPIVLVRILDPVSIGHYKQLFLLASTLQTLLGFGIPASLYYFVPRHAAASQRILLRSAALLVALGVLSAIIVVLAMPRLARLFHFSDTRAFAIIAFYSAASLPAGLLAIVLTVDRRARLAALAIAGFDVLRAAAILTAALVGRHLDAVLVGATFAAALQATALGVYLWWRPRSRNGAAPTGMLRAQLTYAISYHAAIVLNLVREQAHAYYVATLFTPAQFALYAIGALQVPFVAAAVRSVGDVAILRGGELHSRGDQVALVTLWHGATLTLAAGVLPLFAVLEVFADDLFPVMFGTAYAGSAAIFRIYSLMLPMMALLTHAMLRAVGRPDAAARAELVAFIAALATLFPLSQAFGTAGAMSSFIVGSLALHTAAARVLRGELAVPFAKYLPWRELLLLLGLSLTAALAARLAVAALPGAYRLAVGAPAALLAYAALAWRLELLPPELRRLLRRRRAVTIQKGEQ